MSRLSEVERFIVPASSIEAVVLHLRNVGTRGLEGFGLWAGVISGTTAEVTEVIIPKQLGIRTHNGVCVAVDDQELHRINVALHRKQLRLLVQLHSHPTEAYHSDTDDTYPIATEIGSLSLVLPNFANDTFSLHSIAKYRLSSHGSWEEITNEEIDKLILIKDYNGTS